MANFIGQPEDHTGEEIEGDFFPNVQVSVFLNRFQNIKEIDIETIKLALADAVDKVSQQLSSVPLDFATFADFISQHKLSETIINRLYSRAVHHLAMADILSVHITSSDTKDAKDRYDNLQERINTHEAEMRHAISLLLSQPTILARVV